MELRGHRMLTDNASMVCKDVIDSEATLVPEMCLIAAHILSWTPRCDIERSLSAVYTVYKRVYTIFEIMKIHVISQSLLESALLISDTNPIHAHSRRFLRNICMQWPLVSLPSTAVFVQATQTQERAVLLYQVWERSCHNINWSAITSKIIVIIIKRYHTSFEYSCLS